MNFKSLVTLFSLSLLNVTHAAPEKIRVLRLQSEWKQRANIAASVKAKSYQSSLKLDAVAWITGEPTEPDLVFQSWDVARQELLKSECPKPVEGTLSAMTGDLAGYNGFSVQFVEPDDVTTTAPSTSRFMVKYWETGFGIREALVDCPDYTPYKPAKLDFAGKYYHSGTVLDLTPSSVVKVNVFESFFAEPAKIAFSFELLGKKYNESFDQVLTMDAIELRDELPMDLHKNISIAEMRNALCRPNATIAKRVKVISTFGENKNPAAVFYPKGHFVVGSAEKLPLNAIFVTFDDAKVEEDPSYHTVYCREPLP